MPCQQRSDVVSNSFDRNIPMVAFRRGTLENLVYRMGLGEWIEPSEISAVLRQNVGTPYPAEIIDLICRRLEGIDPVPRGRPPRPTFSDEIRRTLGNRFYNRYYNWLKKRKRTSQLVGWSCIRDADWWQGPPSERAARMVRQRLFKDLTSWEHVRRLCK